MSFIDLAIEKQVLRFGDFMLKSGRRSPYFFNAGLFNDGDSLQCLGEYYANAIEAAGLKFDMLFGPAYKGIPLASSVAIAYARKYKRSLPYCFNRKEEKDHGEGGTTFGAKLERRVLIVDDVITAGTSIDLSVDMITKAGARAVGVVIALDRQERGKNAVSALQEVEQAHDLPVISIISLDDLLEYLQGRAEYAQALADIQSYREEYGIATGATCAHSVLLTGHSGTISGHISSKPTRYRRHHA